MCFGHYRFSFSRLCCERNHTAPFILPLSAHPMGSMQHLSMSTDIALFPVLTSYDQSCYEQLCTDTVPVFSFHFG